MKMLKKGVFDNIQEILIPDLDGVENMKLPSIELYEDWLDFSERKLYLDFEIGDLLNQFTKYICRWNAEDEELNLQIENRNPIKIFIDTPGGSLQSCFAFIDILKMSKTPIQLFCLSSALSAGALIFMCKGDNITRYIIPHGSILIHQGSIDPGYNQTHQFLDLSENVKKNENKVKEYILANTKISKQLYSKKLKTEWWIDATEAIELGIADEIISDITTLL